MSLYGYGKVALRKLVKNLFIAFFILPICAFYLNFIPKAYAATVTVECSGTSGSPTAVTEADLAGDDVTFSDTGGDGYCVLDEAISAASVVIGTGVVLIHTAEDVDGVTITTTGDLTVTGDINASGKGCAGGATSGANGRGPNTSTGVCAIDTAGYGDGVPNSGNAYGGGGDYGGLAGSSSQSAGGTTYGTNTAPTLLGSGGGAGNGSGTVAGGNGGGRVRLDVGGTLTVTGSILADGGVGGAAVNGGGGGSGGSIYITTGTIAGSGAISADGGNGGNSTNTNNEDAAGGGGGRIAIFYDTNSSYNFAVALAGKGLKGASAALASDGAVGTTFILNRKTDDGVGDLRITSGLNLSDGTDFARTNITIDSGASVLCDAQTTLNFTASNNFTDNGSTFTCSSAITTLNISAGATLTTTGITWTISSTDTTNISAATWTSSGTNALTFSKNGSTMDWTVTNALTLNNFTITGPTNNTTGTANTGVITMNNAIDVDLVSTNILAGVDWTGLLSLGIDASSSINASERGCDGGTATGGNGYGPDATTGICAITTTGYGDGVPNSASRYGGGGDYGGAGGASFDGAGGSTYGTNTAPTFLGSGGGAGGTNGGNGGGRIRIDVSGELSLGAGGDILADGGAGVDSGSGAVAGGGGSGGSIYITAGSLAGSGTISADGGAGGSTSASGQDGAGGGGGRIAIYYGSDGSDFLSTMTAGNSVTGGATSGSGGLAGSNGTLYTFQYVVFSSAVTSVSGGGSTVNRLTITFNQNVDIVDAGDAGDGLDNISLTASSGTCTISSADYDATNTSTLVLTLSCSATDNTGITIDPTYTTAGSSTIVNTGGANEIVNAETVTGTDGAAPVILTSATGNTQTPTITRLDLTFSEQVDISDAGDGFDAINLINESVGTCTVTTGASMGDSNTTSMSLPVECTTANNTAILTDPEYDTAGSSTITDNAGNEMTDSETVVSTDAAEPYAVSVTYKDVTSVDGTVDRVDIVFSESLSGFSYNSSDWTFPVASELTLLGTGASLATTTLADDTVQLAVSADTGETGHTTTPTFLYSNGGNRVQDASGNTTETWNSAQNVVDGAAPAFLSAVTTSITNIRITMSETLTTATFGSASAWTSTGFTSSAVAINGISTNKLDLTVGTIGPEFTSSDFAFTTGLSGSIISDSASNSTASFSGKTIADGLVPGAPGSFTKASGTGTTAELTWTITDDSNFSHYEIWYGTNETDVENRSGTALEWDDGDDADLATRATTETTVTGLTAGATYYALICAVDNGTNESCTTSISFLTNQTPTVTTPSSITQLSDRSGYVTFQTTVADLDGDETKLKVQYSDDGGTTWYDPYLVTVTPSQGSTDLDNDQTYQIGTANKIDTDSADTTLTIVWSTQSALNGNGAVSGEQDDIKLRIVANDSIVDSTVTATSSFSTDNEAPSGLSDPEASRSSDNSLFVYWTKPTDANFDNYEIWYGQNQVDVANERGSAALWDESDDSSLAASTTSRTTISQDVSARGQTFYVKIVANDEYGNESSVSTSFYTGNFSSSGGGSRRSSSSSAGSEGVATVKKNVVVVTPPTPVKTPVVVTTPVTKPIATEKKKDVKIAVEEKKKTTLPTPTTPKEKVLYAIETKIPKNAEWSKKYMEEFMDNTVISTYVEKSKELETFLLDSLTKPTQAITQRESLMFVILTSIPAEENPTVQSVINDFDREALKVADVKNLFEQNEDFDMHAALSRGQALALLMKVADTKFRTDFLEDVLTQKSSAFKDVEATDKYAPYIQYFYKKGYIVGYKDGTFRQNNPISTAEFIKLLNRVRQGILDSRAKVNTTSANDFVIRLSSISQEKEERSNSFLIRKIASILKIGSR